MGGACSTYGGWGAYRNFVGREQGRNHLEVPDVRVRIILQWIFRNWDRGGTVVKVLCYKSEDRWFDPSLPLVVRRSGCVVSAAEELNESIAGVVFLF